jgi:opacity protein-like surface antigen
MKKVLLATVAFLALGALPAAAQSLSNLDFSVLGGWSSHPGLSINGGHSAVDDSYNLGARVGTPLDSMGLANFSLDADVFFNRGAFAGTTAAAGSTPAGYGKGARLNSTSFMGDLVYHLPTSTPWSFYGGGGLGVVHDNLDGTLHGSSTVMGWQALGGVEYAFTPSTSLFAEYRYQNAHDANIGAVRGVGNTSNNVSIGVKFNL